MYPYIGKPSVDGSDYMIAIIMKVFKNLFGNGSKIHVDEIALKHGNTPKLLSDAVIVDGGSNTNGEWVKFGTGLQICWGIKYGVNPEPSHSNWHNASGYVTWTYPKKFANANVTVLMLARGDSYYAAQEPELVDRDTGTIRAVEATSCYYILYRVRLYQSGLPRIHLVALGEGG